MPQAAPILIAGALGAGAAAIAGTSILIGFAVNAGLALAATLLAPKPPTFDAGGLTGYDPASVDTRSRVVAAVEGARWILGRARTGGSLKFYEEVDFEPEEDSDETAVAGGDVWYALVLSEGACEDIEAVWIDGEEVNFTSSGNTLTIGTQKSDTEVDYSGKAVIYKYLAANGAEGAEIRAACPGFTDAHRFTGVSWMAVHLHQPGYDDADGRFWARPPTVEVLVKGIRVTWPGQTSPAWTENAAALRYWLETERGGLDPSAVDRTAFDAAYAVCDVPTTIGSPDLPSGYTTSSLRYEVNGIVTADMDFAAVRREFDMCWQGWAVEAGGVLYFMPGADRAAVGGITEDDTLEIGEVRPAPALQARSNAISMTLTQSRDNGYQPFDVPETVDAPALARDDSFYLPQDGGRRWLVNTPVTALRLQAIMLRRLRPSLTMSMRVTPGPNLSRLAWKPGDRITVTNGEYGLTDFLVEITRITVDDATLSLVLELDEVRDGAYSDSLDLPPIKRRDISIAGPRSVPAMSLPTLDEIAEVQSDGTTLVILTVSYERNGYRAEVEYRVQGTTAVLGTAQGLTGQVSFAPVAVGTTYEARGRYQSFDGHPGKWSPWANRTIGGDLTAPADPVFPEDAFVSLPGGYQVEWTPPTEDDYAATWIYQNLTDNEEENAVLIAKVSDFVFTRFGFATARQVRLWVRHVDRSGNRSASTMITGDSGAPGATVDRQTITDAVNAAIANNAAFRNLTQAVTDARAARDAAQTAQTAAEAAETAAEAAEGVTEGYRDQALQSARDAASEATDADGSATAAAGSATTARNRATAAAGSATAAAGSATAAAASSTAAGRSAMAAATDAKAAETKADEAGASATAAKTSANDAATEAGRARTAAGEAATSETNADGSAKAAASSVTSAEAAVDGAEDARDDARAAETAARTAAEAASTATRSAEAARDAAGTSATAASTARDAARTSAASAATASTSAATARDTATGASTAAAGSAQGAAAAAGLAGQQATAASESARQAAASATAAAQSATAVTTAADRATTAAAMASAEALRAAAAVETAGSSAAAAQVSQTAAAGFANTARQAIAGLDARVAVEVGENLEASFASVVALRAVAGTARSQLELVALDSPTGSRAAAVITGDLQSANFIPSGGQDRARRAHLSGFGIIFEDTRDGAVGNGRRVTISRAFGPRGVTVSGLTVTLGVPPDGQEAYQRAEIAAARNNANNNLAARGSGFVTVRGDAEGELFTGVLAGGRAPESSVTGRGWILRRDGTAEIDAADIRGKLTADQVEVGGFTREDLEAAGVPFDYEDLNNGRPPVIPSRISQLSGSLSAAQVAAIRINASQIVAGEIAAARISGNLRNAEQLHLSPSGADGTLMSNGSPGTDFSISSPLSNFDQVLIAGLGDDRSGFGSASRYVEPRLIPSLTGAISGSTGGSVSGGWHRINVLGSRNSADDVDIYCRASGTVFRAFCPNNNFRLIRIIGFRAPGATSGSSSPAPGAPNPDAPGAPPAEAYLLPTLISRDTLTILVGIPRGNLEQILYVHVSESSTVRGRSSTRFAVGSQRTRVLLAGTSIRPGTTYWIGCSTFPLDADDVIPSQFVLQASTLSDRTTRSRTFYRRGSSTPSRPSSQSYGAWSGVTGWSRSNPGATQTLDVYAVTLTQNFSGSPSASTFESNSWGSVRLSNRRTGRPTPTPTPGAGRTAPRIGRTPGTVAGTTLLRAPSPLGIGFQTQVFFFNGRSATAETGFSWSVLPSLGPGSIIYPSLRIRAFYGGSLGSPSDFGPWSNRLFF